MLDDPLLKHCRHACFFDVLGAGTQIRTNGLDEESPKRRNIELFRCHASGNTSLYSTWYDHTTRLDENTIRWLCILIWQFAFSLKPAYPCIDQQETDLDGMIYEWLVRFGVDLMHGIFIYCGGTIHNQSPILPSFYKGGPLLAWRFEDRRNLIVISLSDFGAINQMTTAYDHRIVAILGLFAYPWWDFLITSYLVICTHPGGPHDQVQGAKCLWQIITPEVIMCAESTIISRE